VPDSIPEVTVDFATQNLSSWATVTGQWAVEDMPGVPGGQKVLVHDGHFRSGRVGLWTKADSITAFADFTVRGVTAGDELEERRTP
jgi:hypothetical protein